MVEVGRPSDQGKLHTDKGNVPDVALNHHFLGRVRNLPHKMVVFVDNEHPVVGGNINLEQVDI